MRLTWFGKVMVAPFGSSLELTMEGVTTTGKCIVLLPHSLSFTSLDYTSGGTEEVVIRLEWMYMTTKGTATSRLVALCLKWHRHRTRIQEDLRTRWGLDGRTKEKEYESFTR
jgi:hypothetical protein